MASSSFIMKNTSGSPIKFDQLSLCANVSMPRFSKPSYSRYPIMDVSVFKNAWNAWHRRSFTPHTQRTLYCSIEISPQNHSNLKATSQIVAFNLFRSYTTSAIPPKRTNNAAATEPPPSPSLSRRRSKN